jgi:phosphoribosylcarboxyaminoimidazole (NCAIR) mutase
MTDSLVVPEGMRSIEVPRIATMFGSDSDLDQAVEAHEFLLQLADNGRVGLFDEWTNSIHRNPVDVLIRLSILIGQVDAIIVGAGWANQLTGCANAFLRNLFEDNHIVIFGVAIADPKNSIHTQAAILSITELPGSEVVFNNYVGAEGCLRAAKDAASGIYPIITLKEQKPAVRRSMKEALEIGRKQREKMKGEAKP